MTLLHPPYTAWHLSYVAIGASVAPTVHAGRVAAALGAFGLAVGISAHALDELSGRPLRTGFSDRTLVLLAVAGLAGALALGVAGVLTVSVLLVPLILAGALLVPAYNLELWDGRLHTDTWFAVAWGGFPAFTGYFVNSLQIRPAGLLAVGACCLLSAAQRRLSTPVRELRRRTVSLQGEQTLGDGRVVALTRERVAAPLEGALRNLWMSLVLLAAGLLVSRL